MDIEETLRAYESDPTAESTIRKTITDAYQGLRPELETIAKYETEQLPSFYDAFSGYGMGTTAADLSPTSRLQAATQDVARKSALAQVARGIFGTRQAGMEDLIGQGVGQWQTGYGMAQNAYDRYIQQKQFDEQVRQFNASLAAGSGGGSYVPTQTTEVDPVAQWNAKVAKLASGSLPTSTLKSVIPALLNEAVSLGINVTEDALWNTFGGGAGITAPITGTGAGTGTLSGYVPTGAGGGGSWASGDKVDKKWWQFWK